MEKTKKRGEGIEIQLPEPIIQHIQSFLTPKDAARTNILSKSWRAAWSTRPILEFDQVHFVSRNTGRQRSNPFEFLESVMATLETYAESNLNIDRFALRTLKATRNSGRVLGFDHVLRQLTHLARTAASTALRMGATHLDLDLDLHSTSTVAVPEQVLQSETLVRLSLTRCLVDGGVKWSKLKSLKLTNVRFGNVDEAMRSISSSCVSIEEFTLWGRHCLKLSPENPLELRNLKRLFLRDVEIDESFFDEIESRFPCLKELSLNACVGHSRIKISCTSLQRFSNSMATVYTFHLNLPNLAYFRYQGTIIPSITIEEVSKEWQCYIDITCTRCQFSLSWYRKLRNLLYQLRTSKINLSLCDIWKYRVLSDGIKDGGEAVAMQSLRMEVSCGTSYRILPGLFSICRPKFVAYYSTKTVSGENYSVEKEKVVQVVKDQSSCWRFDIEGVKEVSFQDIPNVRVELKWR